jgi:hypothetical protein
MENRKKSLEMKDLKKQNLISKQIHLNGDRKDNESSEMENGWKHPVREHKERRDTTWEGTQEWKLLSQP